MMRALPFLGWAASLRDTTSGAAGTTEVLTGAVYTDRWTFPVMKFSENSCGLSSWNN